MSEQRFVGAFRRGVVMSGVGRMSVRGRISLAALPLAAGLCMSVSGPAMAACVASGTAGINLDCDGTSTSGASVTNLGTFPGISGDDGNMAIHLAAGSVFTNTGIIDVSMAAAANNTAGTNGF